jgi:hypothetical protein
MYLLFLEDVSMQLRRIGFAYLLLVHKGKLADWYQDKITSIVGDAGAGSLQFNLNEGLIYRRSKC